MFVVDVRLRQVRRYPLHGCFGHLYDSGDLEHLASHISVLATSASEVLAFDRTGDLIWKQSDLGIDGVVLQRANTGWIEGEGEWDPPGGWRPFSLSSKTQLLLRSGSVAYQSAKRWAFMESSSTSVITRRSTILPVAMRKQSTQTAQDYDNEGPQWVGYRPTVDGSIRANSGR